MSSAKRIFLQRHICACTIALISCSAPVALCQAAPASNPQESQGLPKSSDVLNAALNKISRTIVGLNISRWKAPGEVRAAAQQNVDSIQRDIQSTLPGLMTQADASPSSISSVFPVYRNVDALYDVLLRVSETANLAAPASESSDISAALSQLESARKQLGNGIMSAAQGNEAELVKLRATIAQGTAAAQQAAPAKTTVVDDGPAKNSSTKRKKKPAPAKTTPEPAPQPPQ